MVREKSRSFSGFNVTVRDGSNSKKLLSNRMVISFPSDRTEFTTKLTIREAKALQSFLNEVLS